MEKKKLSFWQMFNLSFGFFGVQIAYALQSANISRIFATLGADPHQLSFFWILPPLMGMIVQPLIGHWSDRTWCRMGRRKPYLLVGAIVAVLVMIFLPNAGSLNFSQGQSGTPDQQTLARFNNQYANLFRLFRRRSDIIGNVTFWNLSDRDSWLGADNFPLLIDRNYKPKPAYYIVRDLAGEK